jgi:hypothetical protein
VDVGTEETDAEEAGGCVLALAPDPVEDEHPAATSTDPSSVESSTRTPVVRAGEHAASRRRDALRFVILIVLLE